MLNNAMPFDTWPAHKILQILYIRYATNATARETTDSPPVSQLIQERKLRHVACMDLKQSLGVTPTAQSLEETLWTPT